MKRAYEPLILLSLLAVLFWVREQPCQVSRVELGRDLSPTVATVEDIRYDLWAKAHNVYYARPKPEPVAAPVVPTCEWTPKPSGISARPLPDETCR